MIKKILVPVDGPEHANKAIEMAANLASQCDGLIFINSLYMFCAEKAVRHADKPEFYTTSGAGYDVALLRIFSDLNAKLAYRAQRAQSCGRHSASFVYLLFNL